eukprot:612284-Rhodomonas_salina.2
MLVGQSCSGKSTAWTILQDAMNELKKNGVGSYESVKTFIINPKSLKDGELYGEYDLSTGEWLDGVLSRCMRDACADDTPKQKVAPKNCPLYVSGSDIAYGVPHKARY